MSGTDLTPLVTTSQQTNVILTAMLEQLNALAASAAPPDSALLGANSGSFVAIGVGDFLGLNGGNITSSKQITVAVTAGAQIITVAPEVTNIIANGPSAGGAVTLDVIGILDQRIIMNVSQGATAATWTFNFNYGATYPAPTITAVAGKRDVLTLIVNVGTIFDMMDIAQGF